MFAVNYPELQRRELHDGSWLVVGQDGSVFLQDAFCEGVTHTAGFITKHAAALEAFVVRGRRRARSCR